jgi:hypothetical protein
MMVGPSISKDFDVPLTKSSAHNGRLLQDFVGVAQRSRRRLGLSLYRTSGEGDNKSNSDESDKVIETRFSENGSKRIDEKLHRREFESCTPLSNFLGFEFPYSIVIQTHFSFVLDSIFGICLLKIKIFQRHLGLALSIIEVV